MDAYGSGVRFNASSLKEKVIRVQIQLPFFDGARHWRIIFSAPNDAEDQFVFEIPEAAARQGLRHIKRDLNTAVCSGHPPDIVAENLRVIGTRLTKLLLVRDDAATSRAERDALVDYLAQSDEPILFEFNLPVPIELLTFDRDIGGIGEFATMLGGRTACWFANRPHRGKSVGAGLALFHDDQLKSVIGRNIHTAIEIAFDDIDEHDRLLDADLSQVKAEVDRLFYGTSAWAHFQCHNEGDVLQLTRLFLAGNDWFDRESREMAAVFLNTCSATDRSDGNEGENVDVRSWCDHFAGKIHVPAVIGPYCKVSDGDTVAFANALYGELRKHDTIFEAFCEAKAQLLASGDFSGLLYRFVGARRLPAPLRKKQRPDAMDLSDAA